MDKNENVSTKFYLPCFPFSRCSSLKQIYKYLQLYCTIIYNYFKFVLIYSDGRGWHVNKAWGKYTDISLRSEAEDCRSEFTHAVTRTDGRSSRPRLGWLLKRAGVSTSLKRNVNLLFISSRGVNLTNLIVF